MMTILLLLLAQATVGEALIDASTIYVAGAEGKIEALDAASGRVKRTFESAGRPIALAGSKLALELADGNTLRLAVLDAAEGKVLSTSAPLALPEWVSTTTAHGRGFRSWAKVENGALVYDWRASASYAGGAAPPPEMEKAARKAAAGRIRMDLQTYAVSEAKPEEPAPEAVAKATVGPRTYAVVEEGAKPWGGPHLRAARRLTCTSSDPAMPGWSHELRPRFVPVPLPSAPPPQR